MTAVGTPSAERVDPLVPGRAAQRRAARSGALPGGARTLGAAPAELVEHLEARAAALALRARQVPSIDRAMYVLSTCGDDGRIWFAGEALAGAGLMQTAAGARLSGEAVGAEVAAALR